MRLTKPKVLIVEPKLLEKALEAAEEVGLSKADIYLFNVLGSCENDDMQSWETLLQHGEEDWVIVSDPSQAVAHYASTSGTSGHPKAAMLPHSYHVSQAAARLTDDALPYTPRRLTALPPFHVFATPIVPSAIRQGIPTYVMRRFEMKSFISAVEEFQISELFTPPTVLLGMTQSPHCSQEALKSVRQIWFGGARVLYGCQIPLYEMLHQDAKIQPVWGMTEAGWITEGLWHEKHTDDSAGRPLSVFDVR
jgi:acyl-coenzyme A synthetase/AMP-(fatty) acid ligase